MDTLYTLHAEICKTFANAKRLEIINALRDKELTAKQLLEKVKINKANLSQHMGLLVEKGVVISRKSGTNVFYRLSDERITKACELMREVLIKHLEQNNKILMKIKK